MFSFLLGFAIGLFIIRLGILFIQVKDIRDRNKNFRD